MVNSLFDHLESVNFEVDSCNYQPMKVRTGSNWMRHTTVVQLGGGGWVGEGEDVTYQHEGQMDLRSRDFTERLTGRWTLGEWSACLDGADLHADAPLDTASQHYRRWAFESAGLDLALRQSGQTLGEVLQREPRPFQFAVSLGLGAPPTLARIRRILELAPASRFKIDFGNAWTEHTVDELAELGGHVATIDLKAQYTGGDFTGPKADPNLYRRVARKLPDAWLEDPPLEGEGAAVLAAYASRITWDANLHSMADVLALPNQPHCINVKPSRFATVKELCAVLDHCAAANIQCYGGGQFELGPGRRQIQELAALFYPDGANDVAPALVHGSTPPSPFPTSPQTCGGALGFGAETPVNP